MGSTQAIVGLSQQELAADINVSNLSQATGGGLIAALIDAGVNNSRSKKAESEVTPVRDALISYDVGKVLKSDLQATLSRTPWLKLHGLDVRQISDEDTANAWLKAAPAETVLFVRPFYRLSADFSCITISALVTLNERPSEDGGSKNKPLYSNFLACVVPLPGGAGGTSHDEIAATWAANGGIKARQAMNEGLGEIARMITYDLEQANPPDNAVFKAPDNADKRTIPVQPQGGPYAGAPTGYVTATAGEHVWVRMPAGSLYSLHQ